jgi:uncharacterized membrane protein
MSPTPAVTTTYASEKATVTLNTTPDQERYQRAKQQVEVLRGFYVHLLVFVLVNTGLLLYNMATSPDSLWFIYTFVGWGIGLIAHGLYVMSSGRLLGADWRERKIREMMERDTRRTR